MGRPRTPASVLEARGSFKKDPQRRRQDVVCDEPIGKPPAFLNEAERVCWLQIVADAPAGVLTKADSLIVEVTARLMAKVRKDGAKAGDRSQLILCLSKLGMTAVDRSRVTARKEETNAFAEFMTAKPN